MYPQIFRRYGKLSHNTPLMWTVFWLLLSVSSLFMIASGIIDNDLSLEICNFMPPSCYNTLQELSFCCSIWSKRLAYCCPSLAVLIQYTYLFLYIYYLLVSRVSVSCSLLSIRKYTCVEENMTGYLNMHLLGNNMNVKGNIRLENFHSMLLLHPIFLVVSYRRGINLLLNPGTKNVVDIH